MLTRMIFLHSRGSNSSSSSSDSSDDERRRRNNGGGGRPHAAGNFHASSRDVHLEGHSTLVAECSDVNGHHRRTHLDLNDCFTNDNGRLLWQRNGNFAASARGIRVTDNGAFVEAELADVNGHWHHNRVWLDERITNDNGRLALV